MRTMIEVYEFQGHSNVVPGYVLIDCIRRGSADLVMASPSKNIDTPYRVHCRRSESTVLLDVEVLGGRNRYELDYSTMMNELDRLVDNALYSITSTEEIGIVEVRDTVEGYLRLYYSKGMDWPTLFINGVHMHRIAGKGPLADSMAKIVAAGIRPGMRVLDTCMGLGYTAILSAARGATVYTVEVSENVIALAEYNPPSQLIRKLGVTVLHGDIVELSKYMPDRFFDRIIHDPPRFELAGELYSLDFYKQLYRILREGGVLFHYTGSPRKSRGRGYGPIVRGVIERLRLAGFYVKKYDERAQGVIAVKY